MCPPFIAWTRLLLAKSNRVVVINREDSFSQHRHSKSDHKGHSYSKNAFGQLPATCHAERSSVKADFLSAKFPSALPYNLPAAASIAGFKKFNVEIIVPCARL